MLYYNDGSQGNISKNTLIIKKTYGTVNTLLISKQSTMSLLNPQTVTNNCPKISTNWN